jgi:PAS domain S-box-containing protein
MRTILTGAAIAAFVAGIFLVRPPAVEALDDWACDLVGRLAGRGHLSGQVVIVEIDEGSITRFGRWPWPRDLQGLVIRRILNQGAATVVLDTTFNTEDRGIPSAIGNHEPPGSTNDDFIAAVIRGRPVVAGYVFRLDGAVSSPANCGLKPLPGSATGPAGSWETGFFHPSGAVCNVPQLAGAAMGAGFLNAAPDTDGKLRRLPLAMEYGDGLYPSLALAAFQMYRQVPAVQLRLNAREASRLRAGTQTVRLEDRSYMRLRFRGGPRTFPYIAAAKVVDETVPELRGKIVIVGGSALGLPNPVPTPAASQFPEVEIQATAIDNLLQGDPFHRPATVHLWELLLAVAAGVGTTILVARLRPWRSIPIVFCCAVGTWAGCAILLSHTGLLVSPLPLTAVVVFSLPAILLVNYGREKQRAESVERQMASERETARDVLRESEFRYRRLVENINDAIIVDDSEGRLVFANARFRDWFGLEGKDIRDMALEDYVAPEWREPLREWRNRRIAGESVPNHFEYQGLRRDASRIWIEALVADAVEEGKVTGTQWALRDITERKRIQAQYLQAQKMESIGRLAGGVAHDFNNLLQIINGYTEMLLEERPDAARYRTELEEIRGAGQRAAELTRNLLTLSRKEVGKPRSLDVNELVAEAAKMCRRLIGEDIELTTQLNPTPSIVFADSGQLLQILMNLVVNARDAMPQGGRIVMKTRNVGPDENFDRRAFVYIGVTDTGSGMNDDVKRHLFEPFFTTKERGKGTGLGLSTVYGIVEQNSGKIEVTSAPGEGTTIHIYLPRAAEDPEQRSVASGKSPAMKGSETVLLAEDQSSVRRYLRSVLEEFGYRVVDVANGPDALVLAKQFEGTIDLLITDLIMPLMDGRNLAEQLTAIRPGTKVLFMSGSSKEDIARRGMDTPDLVYLQKPFAPEELISKVRELLGSQAHPPGRAIGM